VLTLAASLLDHQQALRRRPSVLATVTQKRYGVPILLLEAQTYTNGVDCPIDGVADASGAVVLARNNAGALETMNAAPGGSWSNRDTVTAGQGFALAYDPVADAILLVYGDGNDLKLRTSSDHGATWSASTTLVTEASAIGSVALALRASNGNACAFYTLGTSTTLKRLRRTAGAWAGSGTNWTRSGSVATLTGLAAVHSGDFYLAITGTEVTTLNPRVWSVAMGDTILPSNAWSTLVNVQESDAASGLSFAHPHAALISSIMFATFQQAETGNVPTSRVFVTSPPESAGPLGFWREPQPTPILTAHGAAIFDDATNSRAVLAGPDAYYHAPHPAALDLSDQLVALSWRLTPSSLKVRAELAFDGTGSLPFADTVRPGFDLSIQHGYLSGAAGAGEYGQLLRCSISRVSQAFESGKLRLIVEADGPWEALARFKAASTWTAPASTTRGAIFSRIAARAGLNVSAAAGSRAPSAAWTADTPAFAIAAGETGRTALERLLAPSVDFVRLDFNTGGLQICSFAVADLASPDYTYAFTTTPGFEHPLLTLTRTEAHAVSRLRVQGPDRYAEAFAAYSGDDFYNPGDEPDFELVRDLAASDNTKATNAAERALRRARALVATGELTAPANVGHELFDTVLALLTPSAAIDASVTARVLGIDLDYRRGPAGGPAYTTTLTLGRG